MAADHLDKILNDALTDFRDAEPLAGLGERVVARVCAKTPARQSKSTVPFLFAFVLAGIAIVCSVLFTMHKPSNPTAIVAEGRPPRAPVEKWPSTDQQIVYQTRQVVSQLMPNNRRLLHPRPLPKKPEFPTTGPVTESEHLLVVLVHQNPSPGALQIDFPKPVKPEPITISTLTISPLGEEN